MIRASWFTVTVGRGGARREEGVWERIALPIKQSARQRISVIDLIKAGKVYHICRGTVLNWMLLFERQ